jgi:hypothetical protein
MYVCVYVGMYVCVYVWYKVCKSWAPDLWGDTYTHTNTHTRVCQYTYYNRWVVYSAISIFAYFITFAFHEHMLEYPGFHEHMLEYPVIRVFQ